MMARAGAGMDFEWDDKKSAANQRKHRVSFAEAQTVLDDPNASIFFDEEHSEDEDRWIAIGQSNRGRVLIVSHTYRDGVIRLISARRATPQEANQYGQA